MNRNKTPTDYRLIRIALVVVTFLTLVEVVIAHIKSIVETLTD